MGQLFARNGLSDWSPNAMDESLMQRAIAAYFSALAQRDVAAFVTCFAEDGVLDELIGAPVKRGHAAIGQFIGTAFGRFLRIGLVIDRTIINGMSAAIGWVGSGVTQGGQAVTFQGIEVLDCNADGKIVTCRAFVAR